MKRDRIRKTIRARRTHRVKTKLHGTKDRPRLCVFRSTQFIELQLIDDVEGKTLVASHDRDVKKLEIQKGQTKRIAMAYAVGKLLAEKAKAKGISSAVFDRRGSQYHGRVAAVAAGAREGGLQF